ncbi:MAG TPA: HIT family protein [Firmicutes bacterium]|nr:HIT family protein [Bacillota bacterium]
MSNCIFCKIINKEIPGHTLYEDEHVLAFLDISQTTKGHTLVIPKKHVADVFSMTEEDMCHVFSVVPKLANAIAKTFDAKGMNIVNNSKEVAGQTVFHFHVHLIPRYHVEHDTFTTCYTNNMANYTPEVLSSMKEDILKNMA